MHATRSMTRRARMTSPTFGSLSAPNTPRRSSGFHACSGFADSSRPDVVNHPRQRRDRDQACGTYTSKGREPRTAANRRAQRRRVRQGRQRQQGAKTTHGASAHAEAEIGAQVRVHGRSERPLARRSSAERRFGARLQCRCVRCYVCVPSAELRSLFGERGSVRRGRPRGVGVRLFADDGSARDEVCGCRRC
jgi:hypothetical protein